MTTGRHLYRFRSASALLDQFHELDRQEIYFSSASEQNDPMEGYRDIVWKGDSIAWRNLFRHYGRLRPSPRHSFLSTITLSTPPST